MKAEEGAGRCARVWRLLTDDAHCRAAWLATAGVRPPNGTTVLEAPDWYCPDPPPAGPVPVSVLDEQEGFWRLAWTAGLVSAQTANRLLRDNDATWKHQRDWFSSAWEGR